MKWKIPISYLNKSRTHYLNNHSWYSEFSLHKNFKWSFLKGRENYRKEHADEFLGLAVRNQINAYPGSRSI